MDYTVEQLKDILNEAQQEGNRAASEFFQNKLNGQDRYPCGFAWVEVYGVKGNTKLGRNMKAAGFGHSDYKKCYEIRGVTGLRCQNVDVNEVGATAAAKVLEKYGFRAYSTSRLD